MILQLCKIHKGNKKVVNKTKNNEIPSIPNVKLIFKEGNQSKCCVNWNLAVELSKEVHKKMDKIRENKELFNAVIHMALISWIKNIITEPKIGISIILKSKKELNSWLNIIVKDNLTKKL